jgi:hypothetical protein
VAILTALANGSSHTLSGPPLTISLPSSPQEATGKSPNVVYASSAAILGPAADYPNTPVPDDYYHKPATIYGAAQETNSVQTGAGSL